MAQIGDLLAEITGEKASPALPAPKLTSATGVKRKANGDSSSSAGPSKLLKPSHPPSREPPATRPTPLPSRPSITARPMPSTSANGQRPSNGSSSAPADRYTGTSTASRLIRRQPEASSSSFRKESNDTSSRPRLNSSALSAAKVAPARPSPTTPTSSGPVKPPKKGSFAEIMARGAKAQQIAPKAGLIQHKAISQTVMSKKDFEQQRKSKWKSGKEDAKPGAAASRGKQTEGPTKNGGTRDTQPAPKGKGRSGPMDIDVPEKKIKKAATASTGYTGTARAAPKKVADSHEGKSSASRSRSGGLLAMPRRRDRYEDEDSELDDFIDDDEDEDDVAPRGYRYAGDYDSDGSSDMEAGADDIYMEEARATRLARQDDAREEAILEKLKREKEARKRRGGY
jgi:protein SPT2